MSDISGATQSDQQLQQQKIAEAVAGIQAATGRVSTLYTAGTAAGSGLLGTAVVMLINHWLPQSLPAEDATFIAGFVTTIAVWIMHEFANTKL